MYTAQNLWKLLFEFNKHSRFHICSNILITQLAFDPIILLTLLVDACACPREGWPCQGNSGF
jgi:hypothetical protein